MRGRGAELLMNHCSGGIIFVQDCSCFFTYYLKANKSATCRKNKYGNKGKLTLVSTDSELLRPDVMNAHGDHNNNFDMNTCHNCSCDKL